MNAISFFDTGVLWKKGTQNNLFKFITNREIGYFFFFFFAWSYNIKTKNWEKLVWWNSYFGAYWTKRCQNRPNNYKNWLWNKTFGKTLVLQLIFCFKVKEVLNSRLTEKFFNYLCPTRHLLVQSQQWKQQNNVWNLFKGNNKDTRITSFCCLYC